MTLTLEDLKNVRFPIAKKNGEGYRAIEVDAFLDQVDETVGSLMDENARLKAQLDGLGDGAAAGGSADSARLDSLRGENESLKNRLAELQRTHDSHVAASGDSGAELKRLQDENNDLRTRLQQAHTAATQQGDGAPVHMVVTTSAEASPAVTRLVQLATEQAEAVVTEANAEANRTIDEANTQAQQITVEAQTRADRVQSEARIGAEQQTNEAQAFAEKLRADAQANADRVNYDADNRRRELFGGLENERQQLEANVEKLRAYEANYRQSLIAHHQQSIEALQGATFEPANAPQPADGSVSDSRTPRLDALLAEGQ